MKSLCVLAVFAASPPALSGDSETPPPGPPWKLSLLEAQRIALADNKPIFVYFTKTY